MDYNFYNFNSKDFEHLVQALMQNIIGNSSLVFGQGRDGARELTYEGSGFFDKSNAWNGYWVVQAKYKSRADSMDDYDWVKKNYDAEINKFRDKKRNLKIPDNYILFTNASLSAVDKTGGIDKFEEYKKKDKDLINNIVAVPYDALCRILDNNRDVAIAYSSFILPGDILQGLYGLLNRSTEGDSKRRALYLFLMKEFRNELNAKLIQAGDSNNNINIEKVFIDIHATSSGIATEREPKFINNLITIGNKSHKNNPHKIVLIGEAGAGKSTLSQFLTQLYSAYFLSKENCRYTEVDNFIKNYYQEEIAKPLCCRFPFKITLKEYAEWVSKRNDQDSISVLSYLSNIISLRSDTSFFASDLRELLSKLSFLFIFDGLDEVPSTSNRSILIKEINSFIDIDLSESKCDALVIATTRPQGFSNEFSQDKFKHLKVCELTDNTCIQYLGRLLNQIEGSEKERDNLMSILKEALKDDVIGRLMRTPLQATIMTILVKSTGEPSNNRFRLFDNYYSTILNREKQKGIHKVLNTHERIINDIHFKLAYNLQILSENSKNPSAYIPAQEFSTFVKSIIIAEGYDEAQTQSLVNNICSNVTERLVFLSEVQDQKIGFVIRSMQEFFATKHVLSLADDDIVSLLEKISRNVYWRNVLLFLVGGLHTNNKRNLVDSVIALCHKMNGNDISPNETNSNKILCLGSWLALEILIEGTFSDSPKNENIFLSLLKPIFGIPPTIFLERFLFLPEKLIDCVIKELINIEFAQNQHFNTFAILVAFLTRNAEVDKKICDLHFSELTKTKEKGLLLTYYLKEFSPDSLLYKQSLEDSLLKYQIDDIYDFFVFEEGDDHKKNKYEWLDKDDYKIKLIEIYFLLFVEFNSYSTHNRHWNNDLLNRIFVLSGIELRLEKKKEYSLIGERVEESISSWYKKYYYTYNINNNNGELLESLISVFKKNSIDYIVNYLLFCKFPSKENAKKFLLSIFNKGEKIFSIFKKSHQIWSLRELMSTMPDFKDLDQSAIIELVDLSDWLIDVNDITRKYDHIKNIKDWSFSHLQDIDGYGDLEEFYKVISSNNSEKTALRELLIVFDNLHDINAFIQSSSKKEDFNIINDNVKKRIASSLLMKGIAEEFLSIEHKWLYFSNYIDISELSKMLDESSFCNFSLDPIKFLGHKYFLLMDLFMKKGFEKVYSIFNSNIPLEKESPVICLVFVYFMIEPDQLEQYGNIDKCKFFNAKYKNLISRLYQILIYLLFSSEPEIQNRGILIDRIKNIQREYDIISLIAMVFEITKINREWMELFIVDIVIYMKEINYKNKSTIWRYYNILYNICEKKLSNMALLDN